MATKRSLEQDKLNAERYFKDLSEEVAAYASQFKDATDFYSLLELTAETKRMLLQRIYLAGWESVSRKDAESPEEKEAIRAAARSVVNSEVVRLNKVREAWAGPDLDKGLQVP